MGEYAQPPADIQTPGVELNVDVEDRDGTAGQPPVIDLPDVAVDVDITDATAKADEVNDRLERLDRAAVTD